MIHVTGAFLFLGGGAAAGILNIRAWHSDRPSEIALLMRLIQRLAVPAIGIGSITTLVLGLWLVHHDGYSYGTFWVWAAIVLWAVAGALGGRGGRYQAKAGAEAARLAARGDTATPELRALVRDPVGNALSYTSGLVLVLILILMIWKPGQ
jgi:Predicted integral membrane protein